MRLETRDPNFNAAFNALVSARREPAANISAGVADILSDVRARGDAAIADLTKRFDRIDLDAVGWQVPRDVWKQSLDGLDADLREALFLAAERIRTFHEKQRPADHSETDSAGVQMGARWSAVESAGLYVPGGLASYPSTVLMNAIPARVAGVERLVMVTPTPDGRLNPLVLAAAEIAGVDEVWRIGGAQAIAALAYGTSKISSVDVIVGPGNAWVAEAKRQLYGTVGIDMVAGPSEILVVADAANDPEWIAADLLSQAEHDATAQSILFTDNAAFADAVEAAVLRQIETLDTADTARKSWQDHGAVIVVEDLAETPPLIDQLAPEHLALAVDDPAPLFDKVRHAGSVFLGRYTPEAVGDYVGGPNHVLPTGRRARFSSGLAVTNFMKRTSFLSCTEASLNQIGPAAARLATAEGLPAHARSVSIRLNK